MNKYYITKLERFIYFAPTIKGNYIEHMNGKYYSYRISMLDAFNYDKKKGICINIAFKNQY